MIELVPLVPGEEVVAINFVQKYYLEDQLRFDARVEAAVADLLAHPEWGILYRIVQDHITVGYMGLTYGYDHEIGGRFGTVTDFYVEPEFRGNSIGSQALEQLNLLAEDLDLKEIGLVVLDHNVRVRSLYGRMGFQPEDGRSWMWKRIS